MTLVLITALSANSDAAKYTAMYVFGDSLTDPGNNKYFVDSLAKADFLPNGIDFSAGPTGRFCNGKIVIDFIAEMVGLPLLPSYADVSAKDASILRGVNYASAGAGILSDTGYRFGRIVPLADQISNLKKTVDELRRQMQENEVSTYLARALVIVDIGANDYLNNQGRSQDSKTDDCIVVPGLESAPVNNYLQPESSVNSRIYNLHQFADLLINRFVLQEIQGTGLRKFIISEASPIGCGPLRIQNRECNATLNKMITMFNRRLKPLVHQLNSNYPESRFVYAPSFQVFIQLYANVRPLCFRDTVPCPNRDEYLFWDAAHPSEAANRIFARLIYKLQRHLITIMSH